MIAVAAIAPTIDEEAESAQAGDQQLRLVRNGEAAHSQDAEVTSFVRRRSRLCRRVSRGRGLCVMHPPWRCTTHEALVRRSAPIMRRSSTPASAVSSHLRPWLGIGLDHSGSTRRRPQAPSNVRQRRSCLGQLASVAANVGGRLIQDPFRHAEGWLARRFRTSEAICRARISASSCSQTLTTNHPAAESRESVSRSRTRFRSSFLSQYHLFTFGARRA